jgi:N-carbamoyl-L-amino-acid hydrolase
MRTNLSINGDRLWGTIAVSARIGTGPKGGLRRLTLTDDDKAMRDLFASWACEGGFELTVDRLGNMFVRREGGEPALPP